MGLYKTAKGVVLFSFFFLCIFVFSVEPVKKNKTCLWKLHCLSYFGDSSLVYCFNIFVFCIRQDILGQFSMVNLELFNIMEDIKKVSKAFVVHPKNVNVENSTSTCYYMELKD